MCFAQVRPGADSSQTFDPANNVVRVNCVVGCSGSGSSTVTANQGTANTQASRWPFFLSNGTSEWGTTSNPFNVQFASAQAVTQSGTWTVQQGTPPWSASQSGTWTMQPGNTANTTPWLIQLRNPGNTATLGDSTNPVRVDPTGTTTQPVSGTVSANLNAGTNRIGSVRPVDSADADLTSAKGTQTSRFVGVQRSVDAGRTFVVCRVLRTSGVTSEALASMTCNKGGTDQTAATSYTVTSGKTFRLQACSVSVTQTSGTAAASSSAARVRAAATVSASSPVVCAVEAAMPTATLQAAGEDRMQIPDGVEIAAGQQIGISHVESATTPVVTLMIYGFEY